jgi:pimeloyl-ACP methyl ester carboxylesterase
MHVIAQALQARGASVFALDLRGHEGGGRTGDVDYVGQLTDDIADFAQTLPARKPGEQRGLVGFSAGGGLALTFAGSQSGRAFNRYVFVSPALAYNAPTARPGFGGWVNGAMPRILVLFALNQVGITTFNGLPTSAFAAPPGAKYATTPLYTFRMAASFGAGPNFLDDLRNAPGKVALVIGGSDEVFVADRYEPLLKPVRPDLEVNVLPGLNHMDMIIKPEAVALIANKALSP